MWRLALGIFLSILPQRWRDALRLNESVPSEPATVLSGFAESLLALILLLYWYSRSVTTWAANALDSALRGGPESAVPGQAIGFSALVLWTLHPLTWLIAYFILEGLVRVLAAAFTDQIFGTFPLAFIDWCYGKATRRPPQGDSLHTPGARAQLQSVFSTLKEKIIVSRLPELEDELVESTRAGESFLEIHASRPKPEWVPPRVVRIGDAYFRLEQLSQGKSPRPFVTLPRSAVLSYNGGHDFAVYAGSAVGVGRFVVRKHRRAASPGGEERANSVGTAKNDCRRPHDTCGARYERQADSRCNDCLFKR